MASAQQHRRTKAIAATQRLVRLMPTELPVPHPHAPRRQFVQQRRLSSNERRFFSNHGSKSEEGIVVGKKLFTYQILQFVHSLSFTSRGGRRSMAVELSDFNAKNECVVKFFSKSINTHCHIPVCLGNRKHLVAVSVAVNQRVIHVYDSRGLTTRQSAKLRSLTTVMEAHEKRCDDIIFCFDKLTFDLPKKPKKGIATLRDGEGHIILEGEIVEKLSCVHIAVQSIQAVVHGEGKGEGVLERKWRLRVVSSFLQQQNDTDCGVFDCLFFECLSRRLSTNVSAREWGQFIKTELGVYRQWLALSVCIGRILGCEHDAKTIECESVDID